MSLVLSSGKKKSLIFSNAVPVKRAVKARGLEPFKQQEKSKLLWAKTKASLAFSLVPTSEASRDARLILHSTVHLAAVAKTKSISQSRENATLLFQMTLIQIKLIFPHES